MLCLERVYILLGRGIPLASSKLYLPSRRTTVPRPRPPLYRDYGPLYSGYMGLYPWAGTARSRSHPTAPDFVECVSLLSDTLYHHPVRLLLTASAA